MADRPTIDASRVPGMQAANRRLARLGVENVDLTYCEHGFNATCWVQVGRAHQPVDIHGEKDQVAAVDALCDRIELMTRKRRK